MIRKTSLLPSHCNLFLCLSLLLCFPFSLLASESSEPSHADQDREIVLKNLKTQPPWMELWEKARANANSGNSENAVALYRELFSQKAQIEEALREYLLLLMDLEQWTEAGTISLRLLEIDPASLEYLLYSGRIALIQKRYQSAANYLGQVYTSSPDGPWSIEALKGEIVALQQLGRRDMAYPLMEQLYLLLPHEEDVIRELAQYSVELGHPNKALTYYKTLLTEFNGTDLDFIESEPLFEVAKDQEMLLHSWLGYLKFHPFYIPFHKKLSTYYLDSGQGQKALAHHLVRIAHGEQSAEIFLQTGKLYLYQEGRPDKALYYYEEYRKRSPADREVASEIKRIQAILANDLLVIVENEGAWNLWRDLAKVIPDRLAVYYSMAEQLESLGKEDELLEVLQIIHTHNPDDQKILFQLAQLYLSRGESAASTNALDLLQEEKQTGKEYFFLRAEIAAQNRDYPQVLKHYKQYLMFVPKDYPVVLKGLKLSGETGLIEELNYFHSLLPEDSQQRDVFTEGNFLYGEALLLNKLYSIAEQFFNELRIAADGAEVVQADIEEQLVKAYQGQKKFFEAEQKLRILLTGGKEKKKLLQQLIQINLVQKDWFNSWKWYEFLVMESENENILPSDSVESVDLFTEKIAILAHSGQVAVAIEMGEYFLNQLDSPCAEHRDHCFQLKSILVELYYRNKDYAEAKVTLDSLAPEAAGNLELNILGQLIQAHLSDDVIPVSSVDQDTLFFATQLDRARVYKKYGEYQVAQTLCERYLERIPGAVGARVLHAEILRANGDDFTSLALFKELATAYPEEKSFKQNILELQFTSAKFADLIEELAPQWKSVKGSESTLSVRKVVPEIETLPIPQKLLLARAFWADKRMNDALVLYKSLLQSPVDQKFTEQLAQNDIVLRLAPPKRSFLNRITFTRPAEPDRLSVVMSPEFTREHIGEPVVAIASDLYATYRWQQIVSKELSVRQAMYDGNYYQAMKEYQKILDSDTSSESLYDLAGVYSRLGFSGKEAALYKILKKKSPGYPDLDEAIQRNSLKRQPRVTALFALDEKEGREDYFDIRQKSGGLQAWLMPNLNNVFLLDARSIHSTSDERDQDLWRNRIKAELQWSPTCDLDILLGLGADRADDDYGSTFLYDLRVNGRIGDMVQGYVGLSQDVVDDTAVSLMEGISSKEYGAGVRLDFLPRLFGGAEYLFTEYSDGNHQNRYGFWTSYTLFSEPTLLQFRYGYDYSHNAEGNMGRDYSYPSGFAPGDHPYWSPKEYWQHLFSVSFEHQLAEDVLGRGAPSYYTLEYSFGYENGGYDNHQAKAQIFLEMSRHFLLNSTFELTQGAGFKKMNFLCSIIYRW